MNYQKMTAIELSKKIKNKEISAVEVTKAHINYIKEKDGLYNCFITLLEEEALKQAEKIQEKIGKGEFKDSPLVGVPMAIKDNICTKDIRTTCASKMLEDYVPSYNAKVVDKLVDGGAIILGKLNMDEFAMGSSSETSYFSSTKNPVNPEYVPGGSSGGSAAAVAAGEVLYTLGSDTGGSIRQPSSYCGVTGIKPTYGTVSRSGLIGFASSFDQIGPIAKNISDATAVLDIIKGYDKNDSSSLKRNYDQYSKELVEDVKGLKIAIPREYLESPMNEDVRRKLHEAIDILKDKGASIDFIKPKTSEYIIPTYYILASAEASSNLARFDGIKYGYRSLDANNLDEIYTKSRSEAFGDEVKLRILLGNYVLSAANYEQYYNKALKLRRLINNEFEDVLSKYDLIMDPTNSFTAFKFKKFKDDPVKKYSSTDNKYTILVNIVGAPAISLPCGVDKEGLPIGLQLIGRKHGEKDIIRTGYTYEKAIK